jgi:hypothetical protein
MDRSGMGRFDSCLLLPYSLHNRPKGRKDPPCRSPRFSGVTADYYSDREEPGIQRYGATLCSLCRRGELPLASPRRYGRYERHPLCVRRFRNLALDSAAKLEEQEHDSLWHPI